MRAWLKILVVLIPVVMVHGAARAQGEVPAEGVTPPRLSYLEGDVSFWRPGAEDWAEAWLNTPIAVGDALYTGDGTAFELQIGSWDFVRADERTQVVLENHAPDFLQFKVTTGRVSLDLRQLPLGQTVEVDTPNAVFTITQSGYYRVDVDHETRFTTRQGGRATVTVAGGRTMSVFPAEEIVVSGAEVVRVETYVAPEPDAWDRWNYARSEDLIDAVSARYLPPGVYGADELDHYGSWRVVEAYGPVWVPDRVAPGWSPYSTGRWIWDPYYEWTWVDDAPWGWAPFHYGRWIYLGGVWAWAPGPVVVRPVVYAPALVAFFLVGHDVSVRIGIGSSGLAWVSLGWGEPLLPWWGRPGFRGVPWWGGWAGPRVVNNVVIKQTTVVHVTNIVYQNSKLPNAVVVSPSERFGRREAGMRTVAAEDVRQFEKVRGAVPVKPGPTSLTIGGVSRVHPPQDVMSRPVLSTRPPAQPRQPWRQERAKEREAVPGRQQEALPVPTYVAPPKARVTVLPRPEFGSRSDTERQRPPRPPRYEDMRTPPATSVDVRKRAVPVPKAPEPARVEKPETVAPPARMERQAVPSRQAPEVRPERRLPPQPAYQEKRAPAQVPGEVQRSAPARGGSVPPRKVSPAPARSGTDAQQGRTKGQPPEEPKALPGKPANRIYREERSSGR